MRSLRGGLIAACAIAIGLVAVPGAGATSYAQKGTIGAGVGLATGVAVDQSTGNIYIAAPFLVGGGIGTIARFDSSGAPLSPATMGAELFASVAVNPSAPHGVYAAVLSEVLKIYGFTQAGSELGSPFPFPGKREGNHPNQIAVSSTGGILRADTFSNAVREYSPTTGELTRTISCSACPGYAHFANPTGVATDAAGNIYVASEGGPVNEVQLVELSASGGSFTLSFEGETTAPIGDLNDPNGIRAALEALPTVGAGNVSVKREPIDSESSLFRIAFEGSLGEKDVPQLVADGSSLSGAGAGITVVTSAPGGTFAGRIVKFGPQGDADPAPPTVFAADPASGITVNPANGNVFTGQNDGAGWHVVEYDSAGSEVSDFGLGSFDAGLDTATLQEPGGGPSLAVDDDTGVVYATDVTEEFDNGYAIVFAPVTPPTAVTDPATEVGAATATLNGKVNPEGEPTIECRFEYTTKADFEANGFTGAGTEPCDPEPGEEEAVLEVSAEASGLSQNTDYVYRVVEETEAATAEGDEQEFKTLTAAPKATTEAASGVSQTKATLNAKVDAEGNSASCEFEYGTTAAYGSKAPCSLNPVTGVGAKAVTAAISGLSAGTTYHFRVVAQSIGGKKEGNDVTFTTAADTCETNAALCPPPPKKEDPLPPPPPPPPGPDKAALHKACLDKAKAAFKRAQRAARKKKGKAKARAMRAASKAKAKATKRCNAQLS